MARFSIKHPTNRKLSAVYGFDRALGYFGEVHDGKRVVAEYDRTHPPYLDRDGLLKLLENHGFFTEEQLQEARLASQHYLPDEMESDLRLAGKVLGDLESAGD